MAIKLRDLLNMSQEEIISLFPSQNCRCGGRIKEHPDEHYKIKGKPVCSDCYYSELGKVIEMSPICSPRVHRG